MKKKRKENESYFLSPKRRYFLIMFKRKNNNKSKMKNRGHKALIVAEKRGYKLNLSLTEEPLWGHKKNIEIKPPSKGWRSHRAYIRKDASWDSEREVNSSKLAGYKIRDINDQKKIQTFLDGNRGRIKQDLKEKDKK